MEAFLVMLKNVALFVLMAVPGYVLTRAGALKEEQSGVLSRLLVLLGVPFLMLSGTLGSLTLNRETAVLLLAVFVGGTAVILATYFLSAPLMQGEKEEKKRRMMRLAAVFSNNGFLGLPLANAVFGPGKILTIVVVLNVVNNVLLNTLGVYLVSGDKKAMNWKKALLSPVLISFLLGVCLNLLRLPEKLPEAVTYCNTFSGIVTPLSMTVIGMKLGSVRFSSLFRGWRIWYVSALRLVIFPALIVGVLLALKAIFPGSLFDGDLICAFFIGLAMPTAALSAVFADAYHGDSEGAVRYTLGTTLLSAVTLPLLYSALCAVA